MKRTRIVREWEFMKGEPSSFPGMAAETKTVNLPHDFMIESDVFPDSVNRTNTGFYNGGTATYTKYIDAPETWENRRILVNFDGVFGAAKVILNGHVVGKHHYGYTPFRVDLTKEMKPGKRNRLAVVVSNASGQDSRWYSGAGIYRHVDLLEAPKLHIAPEGTYAHADHIIGEDAFVIVETTVENRTAEDRDLWVEAVFHRLLETGERELSREEKAAACGTVKVHVPAGSSAGIQIVPIYRYDITDFIWVGENKIIIEAATTLERKCYDMTKDDPRMKMRGLAGPKCGSGITGQVFLYTVYKNADISGCVTNSARQS